MKALCLAGPVLLLLGAAAAAAPGGFFGGYLIDEQPSSKRRSVRVSSVAEGSPAASAGLLEGDRILRCQGQPATANRLGEILARAYPGDVLRLQVLRAGEAVDLSVTLGTWGAYRRAQEQTKLPKKVGESIYIAGEPFRIGAPVVTWRDPGGFDGYFERCHFNAERVGPSRPVKGCEGPRRYARRRNLQPALAQVVAAKGWSPELAAVQIDQVVVHYDVAWTSSNCFKVLHDLRGLSCQFMLGVDGTLYQTLDVVERARHAGSANDRSIGIEIAHPGPLELTKGLADRYRKKRGKIAFDLGERLAPTVRTPRFVVRPARQKPVTARVQGRVYSQYDYTNEQYETLIRLLAALNRVLPRIRLKAPLGADGEVRDAALSAEEQQAFSGILGHYHVSKRKQDPGPAFHWERVLSGARKLADPESARSED